MSVPSSYLMVVATVVVAACLGSVEASHGAGSATWGRPPAPSRTGEIIFLGTFADTRWAGEIRMSVSVSGRNVGYISGIAPGRCQDRDFGEMLPGRDGATGVMLTVPYPRGGHPIGADGRFAVKERNSGLPSPYDKDRTVTISGTFSGNTVRGRVRARYRTSFDTCSASASFTARRVAG